MTRTKALKFSYFFAPLFVIFEIEPVLFQGLGVVDPFDARYLILLAMDSQTKARYSVLRDKDWETLGYTEIPYFRQYEPELEGDIHPIFQYTIPGRPDSFPIWPFYTQQEYQGHLVDLNPVFRLATKILRSPGSLDFFYWLIFSPRTHAEPPVWNLGERVSQYRRDEMPEDDRRRMATAALDRFALTHRITIGGIEQAGLTTAMLSEQEEGINIKDDSSTPNGVKSWIALNEKFLDQLARLRAEGSANHLKIFKLRLKMAITILHEVAVSITCLARLRPGIVIRVARQIT